MVTCTIPPGIDEAQCSPASIAPPEQQSLPSMPRARHSHARYTSAASSMSATTVRRSPSSSETRSLISKLPSRPLLENLSFRPLIRDERFLAETDKQDQI